jgi:hypothetical protein
MKDVFMFISVEVLKFEVLKLLVNFMGGVRSLVRYSVLGLLKVIGDIVYFFILIIAHHFVYAVGDI